jgi:hypothetical protein
MSRLRAVAVALLGWALVGGASAQAAVYRCGSEYRPTPCPGGESVQVGDERTPAQRREAGEAARADARTASQLERERHAREAAVSGPPIGGFYTVPRAAPPAASAPAKPKGKAGHRKKKPRTPSAPERA